MTEIYNTSDHSGPPNQSMSTDSEESFLMKQINKSQLFNNSSSSGSTGQRRSHFRESYLDEDGNLRSFSVYQDVINETSDESRDISLTGLSSLNIDQLVNHEPRNSVLANILNEVDDNSQVKHTNRKSVSLSRSDSSREQQLRKNVKRMSHSSFRISAYAQLPLPGTGSYPTSGSGSGSGSSGNVEGSDYAKGSSQPSDSGIALSSQHDHPQPPLASLSQRVPSPEFRVPYPPVPIPGSTEPIIPNQADDPLEPFTGLGQIPHKKSSSTLSSFKSARSTTRESILNFEETRKRQKGTPHLLTSNAVQNAQATVKFHSSTDNATIDAGVIPSIHSPSSENFTEVVDDISIRDTRRAKVYSGDAVVKKPAGLKEFKLRPTSHDYSDTPIVTPYYLRNPNDDGDFADDSLLEKIQFDRSNRPVKPQPNTNVIAWLIFCVSFIIPPLFFFLGLGLLDSHIGNVSVGLKRISILTGVLYLMIALAMIGVGFGVGITQAQA